MLEKISIQGRIEVVGQVCRIKQSDYKETKT
jgi:hypothetical protein